MYIIISYNIHCSLLLHLLPYLYFSSGGYTVILALLFIYKFQLGPHPVEVHAKWIRSGKNSGFSTWQHHKPNSSNFSNNYSV